MVGVLTDQSSYYLGKYEEITGEIEQKGAEISFALGLSTNVTITAPLEGQFLATSDIKSFMNGSILPILIFLSLLSAMLLYSLMLADVDSKTYEYGMLRALGFRKQMLVGMITEQSLMFSLPGLTIGIFVAWILNIQLRKLIFISAQNYMTYELTSTAILIGVSFGLIMPLLANYLPIRSALGMTLRNSLDLNRRTDGEIGVKIKKLEDIGIDTNSLIVSFLLIGIGFTTYYLVPYAFFHNDMTMANSILNCLLILIIIGLTLICVLVFPYLEWALLWIAMNSCCKKDKRLMRVIETNMNGHRRRNSKTSIMFTLAISFLIFSASSFELILSLIEKSVLQLIGADMVAVSFLDYVPEIPIANFLDTQISNGQVLDYSFVAPPLNRLYSAARTDLDHGYELEIGDAS